MRSPPRITDGRQRRCCRRSRRALRARERHACLPPLRPFHDHGQQTDGRAGSAWRVCGRRREGDAGGGERGERGELGSRVGGCCMGERAAPKKRRGGGFTAFKEEEKERDGGRTRRAPLPRRARAPFPSSSPQCDCVRRQRPRPASSASAATLSRPIGSDERNTPSLRSLVRLLTHSGDIHRAQHNIARNEVPFAALNYLPTLGLKGKNYGS